MDGMSLLISRDKLRFSLLANSDAKAIWIKRKRKKKTPAKYLTCMTVMIARNNNEKT